jgi:homogentisate phytyltransferase / homogentisate geranylgeranyltransferase
MRSTGGRRRRALVGFSRPHTVIGTATSVAALFVMARALPTPDSPGVGSLGVALLAGLAVNIYIVGLNQLTDVDIDRINKPWLPLPAGELSPRTARWLVGVSLATGVVAGAGGSVWLLAAVLIAAAVGTSYSLQPLRLKRHHALAAASIVSVRGLVVNILIFLHFAAPAATRPVLPPAVVALTAIVVVIGLVIAWFKDLTDMDGDKRHRIATLPLRVGPRRVVAVGVGVLLLVYAGVAMAGAFGIPGLHRGVLALGHVALGGALAAAVVGLNVTNEVSAAMFYRRIWGLFYAEYAVFGLAALVG